jgi:Flp pilus assembly protein CpaB
VLTIRHRLRRHPFLFWLFAVAVTIVSARWAEGAPAAKLADQFEVLVAARPIAAGEVLTTADTARRLVSADALADAPLADDPVGATARSDLAPGEVLLAHHLGRSVGPPGSRLVAVAVDGPLPPLRPGDLVDVLATFEVDANEPGHEDAPLDPTVVVAEAATVAAVDDHAVTVAVPAEVAPRLAFALARAVITIARR